MQMDRFTIKAVEAIQNADRIARDQGHSQITPLHLLAAMTTPNGTAENGSQAGIVGPVLEKTGANLNQIRSITQSELGRLPKVSGAALSADSALQDVLHNAQTLADKMKDQYVSTEHLLIALADVKSEAKEILTVSGADKDSLLNAIKESAAARKLRRRTRKTRIRHSSDTATISSPWRDEVSSTLSLAAMRRSAAACRYSRAAPRTTRC